MEDSSLEGPVKFLSYFCQKQLIPEIPIQKKNGNASGRQRMVFLFFIFPRSIDFRVSHDIFLLFALFLFYYKPHGNARLFQLTESFCFFFAVRLDEAGLNIYNSDDSAVIKTCFSSFYIMIKKKEIRVLLWADRDFFMPGTSFCFINRRL